MERKKHDFPIALEFFVAIRLSVVDESYYGFMWVLTHAEMFILILQSWALYIFL